MQKTSTENDIVPLTTGRCHVDDMLPLEKLAYTLKVNVYGLSCFNQSCDYKDLTVPLDRYIHYIGTKCPKCNSELINDEAISVVMRAIAEAAAKNAAN